MSTDSSPSPDGSDKSKKSRSRKPDIQLYVPRGKRIEAEAKQHKPYTSSYDKDQQMLMTSSPVCLTFNNNNYNANNIAVDKSWKLNPLWLSSSYQQQDEKSATSWEDQGQTNSSSNSVVISKSFIERFPSSVDYQPKLRNTSSTSDISPPNDPKASQKVLNDKTRRPPHQFPQPDPSKLPSRQIHALLKGLDISSPRAEEIFVEEEIALANNVPYSVTDRSIVTTDAATFIVGQYVTTPTENVTNQLDFVTTVVDTVVDKVSTTKSLTNKNEGDFLLDSLPTSYDEFENADASTLLPPTVVPPIHTNNNDYVMHEIFGNSASTSIVDTYMTTGESALGHAMTSSSALLNEPRTSTSSCSSAMSTTAAVIDPDDLEVQLINESFEQAQVLSNIKTKEAFYRHPNHHQPPQQSSSSCVTTITSSAAGKTSTSVTTDKNAIYAQNASLTGSNNSSTVSNNSKYKLDAQTPAVLQQNLLPPVTISLTSGSSSAAPSSNGGKGLTWAGWGGGAGGVSKSSDDPPGYGGGALSATKKSSSSVSSSCSADLTYFYDNGNNTHEDADANDIMDVLSKAMIDKVLSDDDEDDNNMGANLHIARNDDNTCGQRAEAGQVSTSAATSIADDKRSSAADEKFFSQNVDVFAACSSQNENDLFESRRSTTANVDESYLMSTSVPDNEESASLPASVADSWEDICDSNVPVPQLKSAVVESSLNEKPKIDYLQFKPRDIVIKDNEFGHVLEAYGFSSSMKSETLYLAVQQLDCKHFSIQWIDDTHALVVCSDQSSANNVLDCTHPEIKLRPLCLASEQSKRKAKEFPELLRCYKPRPETNRSVALRLVESHLGKKTAITPDQRNQERQKLQKAKEQKRVAVQMREDVWEGRV